MSDHLHGKKANRAVSHQLKPPVPTATVRVQLATELTHHALHKIHLGAAVSLRARRAEAVHEELDEVAVHRRVVPLQGIDRHRVGDHFLRPTNG